MTVRSAPFGESGSLQRVLHCRPTTGDTITGQFARPERGPARLYMVVSKPMDRGPDPLVSIGDGKTDLLAPHPIEAGPRTGIVVDIPAGTTAVTLRAIAPEDPGPAEGLYVHEAYLVGMLPTVHDWLSTATRQIPTEGAAPNPGAFLADRCLYGPACLELPRPEEDTGPATLDLPLPALPAGGTLRALLGFPDGTTAGAGARVSFACVFGDRVVPVVENVDLKMREPDPVAGPGDAGNPLTVLAVGLPDDSAKAGTRLLRVTVTPPDGRPSAAVALTCLRVTSE